MSPRPRSDWPFVDTVYCEAKCPDEDIYYFGSDDDQYETPRERKRRYELAGQRFLGGSAPRLFSAALRGPFESNKGWKNPWASKAQSTRTARQPDSQINQSAKAPRPIKTAQQNNETNPTHTRLDKSGGHLPSPQSLKAASLSSGAHPFLEDEELQAVQTWRHSIRSTEPNLTPQSLQSTTDRTSPRKRKASHNWLKTVPAKRSRIESVEKTTERQETSTSTLPDLSYQDHGHKNATPNVQLQPETILPPRAADQLISPPKQSSTNRNTNSSAAPIHEKARHELSKEQRAAATLSSPVSLQNVKQEKHIAQPSPLKFKARIHSISDASSEPSNSSSPNTTAVYHKANTDIVNKPYQIPDDEGFVFDIAMDPVSESSESEDEESSENVVHVAEDGSREMQHNSAAMDEQLSPDIDGSSDSELTELSESPEMSDWEGSADESAEESEVELDEVVNENNEEVEAVAAAETEEPVDAESMDTVDDIPLEEPTEAEDASQSESLPTKDDTPEAETVADSGKAVSIPAQEGSEPVDNSESCGTAGAEVLQSEHFEDVPQFDNEDHIPSPVDAGEQPVEREARVTDEPLTQSMTEAAVPPSPRVKQESSEFSLKAIFKSFVPTNPWAQLSHLASGPSQTPTHQSARPAAMGEHVLPSVEHIPAEEYAVTPIEAKNSQPPEPMELDKADDVSDGAEEPCQQLLSEQDSAQVLDKLPVSPTVATEDGEDGSPRTAPEPRAIEHDQTPVEDEGVTCPEDENAAVSDVSAEQNLPSKEATLAPSTSAGEMPTPAAIPGTPVQDKTPMPFEKTNTSEPRFAFKSFAAFTTPSPERLRVKKRRTLHVSSLRHPNLKGILSSRKAGAGQRTSNRVSWQLPGEQDTQDASPSDKNDALASSRDAPCSPPPRTPLAELPTASNEKFAKHFSSVVKRTDGLRHRFHVAADNDRVADAMPNSQCTSSHTSRILTKDIANMTMKDAPGIESSDTENQNRPREATMSVEPMDMVEDMVREMGDFWQAWDVDAELNAAKKAQTETVQPQNAWR